MFKGRSALIGATVILLIFTLGADAQATRTWVSGVGDDANPCSRTAPCKTFAGAISKTAANGEISVLDPGGFGAVTITKGMRIDGKSFVAGILAAGTNGVVINTTQRVTLANLQIIGAGSGIDGVRVLNAASVTLENVEISNFTGDGVEVASTGSTNIPVQILNSTITNVTGTCIKTNATIASIALTLGNSYLGNCGIGLNSRDGTTATVTNSVISSNTTGVQADLASIVNLNQTHIASNATGIASAANGSVIRLFGSFVQNNTTNGFNVSGPSTIVSAGNNSIQTAPANVGVLGSIGQQ